VSAFLPVPPGDLVSLFSSEEGILGLA
jgi:hypothetical protein